MSKHGNRFSALTTTKDIHHEDWEEDEIVTIGKFTLGHRQSIEGKTFDLQTSFSKDGDVESGVNVQALQNETLIKGIRSWNFTDATGRVMPLNRASLSKLNPDDGAWIFDQINKYNQPDWTVEDLEENENLLAEEEGKEKPHPVIVQTLKDNIKEIQEALAEKREKFPESSNST